MNELSEMPNGETIASRAAAESLLAFWADAGVDAMLSDDPTDRIAAGLVRPAPQATPAPLPRAVRAGQAAIGPDVADALGEARRAAAGAKDFDALIAAIEAFDGCPLKFAGAASKAVVYRGALDAPVMIVGEAPGAEEDQQGKPFVGRSGQLLDRMLAAAGLSDRVMIINTVFWRPPGNRTPVPAEQMVCAPFLERAIELVKPRLLLLAGGASAKFMLKRDEGVLSLRGRWFEWRSSDEKAEIPAMPTLHPAFLLRQPGAKKHAWSDLMTLAERLDRPERPA